MEINVSDLTTMDLQGDGAFDNIMTAMQTRLDREFKKNRLVGPEYAKVYLGSYEASLMNAVQFVLGRQEAGAKAELIKEQTLTEVEQRKLVQAQISKMKAEERLIDGQIDKMEQEILVMKGEVTMIPHKIDLLIAEVEKMRKEGELIDGQIKKMVQEILLMERQATKMLSEIELMKKQVIKMDSEIRLMIAQADKTEEEVFLIKGQVQKMQSEILVMEQQVLESEQKVLSMKATVWAERAKTNSDCEIFGADYNPTCTGTVSGLVGMQITKALAEGELIGQKFVTEQAQTNDLVGVPARVVTGVIGKQKALFQKQTDGFDRDAEQKLSKILVDTWNVRRTTDDNYSAGGTGLEDDQINNVLDIAKDGIGAPPNDFSGGGGTTGEIAGVTVDIVAHGDILEDCHADFESHVIIDNLPGVSIRSWEWWSPEGRDLDHQGPITDLNDTQRYQFQTGFWEPGDNPIILEIILSDTDTSSEYHNHKIRFTKIFYATATDGGCLGGIRPDGTFANTGNATPAELAQAAKDSIARPEQHDLSSWLGNDGVFRSNEGHKPVS